MASAALPAPRIVEEEETDAVLPQEELPPFFTPLGQLFSITGAPANNGNPLLVRGHDGERPPSAPRRSVPPIVPRLCCGVDCAVLLWPGDFSAPASPAPDDFGRRGDVVLPGVGPRAAAYPAQSH